MVGKNRLGRFLRDCRERLRLTSRQVALRSRKRRDLTPMSHSNVLAIERGRHFPTLDKALTLAALYQLDPGLLSEQVWQDMQEFPQETADPGVALDRSRILAAARRTRLAGDPRTAMAILAAVPGTRAGKVPRPTTPPAWQLELAECQSDIGLRHVARATAETVLGDHSENDEIAIRALVVLARFHRRADHSLLALVHSRAAVDRPGAPPAVAAAALIELGLCLEGSDQAAALHAFRRAIARAEEGSSEHALALLAAGRLFARRGALAEAEAALERARLGTFPAVAAQAAVELIRTARQRGARDRAREIAEAAKLLAQQSGRDDLLFVSLYHLWLDARETGHSALAAAYSDRLTSLLPAANGLPEARAWHTDDTQETPTTAGGCEPP